MSLQPLQQTLIAATAPDGSLPLTGAMLGSTDLGDTIARLAPTGTLSIAAAAVTLSPDGDTLTVTGATTIGKVAAAKTIATITQPDGALQMVVSVALDDGTPLADPFALVGDAALAAVTVDDGALILSSLAYVDAGTARTFPPGLTLTGTIAPVAVLPVLAPLLPAATRLALAGPVADIALPLFDVTTTSLDASLAGVPLPSLALEFTSELIAPPPADPVAVVRSSLRAGITIGGVTGATVADLPADGGLLAVSATFAGLTLASFDDLAAFIGGADPLGALPEPIGTRIKDVGSRFALTTLDLLVDTRGPAFPMVRLGVAVDLSGFPIFGPIKALSVDELDLSLTVSKSGATVVTYGASATIAIGTGYGVLLGFQTLPTGGYQLSVAQAPGSTLGLTDIASTFLPELGDLPALDVAQFGLVALPATGQYSFAAVIESDWTVLSAPAITLDQLAVSATYDPTLQPSTSGSITGIFVMAVDDDPDDDIVITLSATKPPAGDGWLLSGETGPDEVIPVGNLIQAIEKRFDTTATLPTFLSGLGIENLGLSFATADKAFHFGAEIVVPFDDSATLTLVVALDVEPLPTGCETTFRGTIQIAQYQFDIVFDDRTGKSDTLIAAYRPAGDARQAVTLRDLIAALSPTLADDVPIDVEIDLKDVKFVFYKEGGTNRMAFGLDVGLPIDLSNIPVVGDKLGSAALGIANLQGVYATAAFAAGDAGAVNALLPDGVVAFPADGLAQGVNLAADLTVAGWTQRLQLGGGSPAPTPTPAAATSALAPATAPAAGSTTSSPAPVPGESAYKWINVNKQVGIFQFDRLGAGYVDNRLTLALDAGVTLGPLGFSMLGLSVGMPLDAFAPVFDLNGLGFSFSRPPLRIGGGFLKVKEGAATSYYGQVTVNAATFGFSALGGWTDATPASFFLYANVDIPMGGPPYLQLKAIAAGIGINRSLILPTIDRLAGYVLLPANAPAAAATPAATVAAALPARQEYFVDRPGEYWAAAGVAFSSFEMIDAFALLTVSFGVDVQIGILGSCSMSIPTQGVTPVAYIEADLLASFAPAGGLLSFEGVLSPQSFVFGGFVKIQGGFAMCLWFSGENAGDFVVSVGGYHPAFARPDHYPDVPRIRIGFALGPVSVTGQAYFALTPANLMAGVSMNAVLDAGPIRAWFDGGVDLLIAWSPFSYQAHSYVTVGVSLDVGLFTLDLQAGADLLIWGPEFGGKADVDLDVVSFSFNFGAPAAPPPPVGWSGFRQNFLPPDVAATAATNILKVNVRSGLVSTAAPGYDAIVAPSGFLIEIASTVPANAATLAQPSGNLPLPPASSAWNAAIAAPGHPHLSLPADVATFSDDAVWNPALDIAPMKKAGITSTLSLSVLRHDGESYSDPVTDMEIAPSLLASNTAMWKIQEVSADPNAAALLPATLVGLTLSPAPRTPDKVSDVPLISLLFGRGAVTGFDYATPVVVPGYEVAAAIDDQEDLTITVGGDHSASLVNGGYRLSALMDPWIVAQRAAIAADLVAAGFGTVAAPDLTLMATRKALTDWPIVRQLGA